VSVVPTVTFDPVISVTLPLIEPAPTVAREPLFTVKAIFSGTYFPAVCSVFVYELTGILISAIFPPINWHQLLNHKLKFYQKQKFHYSIL